LFSFFCGKINADEETDNAKRCTDFGAKRQNRGGVNLNEVKINADEEI